MTDALKQWKVWKTVVTVWISTGDLRCQYTLHKHIKVGDSQYDDWRGGTYVKNLGINREKAVAEARAYLKRFNTENYVVVDKIDAEFNLRDYGLPNARERALLHQVELGFFPFGKNIGKRISSSDVSEWAIKFWAEETPRTNSRTGKPDVVGVALIEKCKQVAIEEKLYLVDNFFDKAKDIIKAIIEPRKIPSVHIGTVGERQEFVGTLEFTKSFDNDWGGTFLRIFDVDGNTVIYWGTACFLVTNPDGSCTINKGRKFSFSAKVKKHDHRDGVAQTIIQRPTKIKAI